MSEMNQGNDPISEARLAANRENAQKSPGPVPPPEGKAKSSLNAVQCGLTGNFVLVTAQDAPRYHAHVQSYETQFEPVGPEESALVQSILDIRWRLNRIPGLEQAILVAEGAKIIEENPTYARPEAASAIEREVRLRNEKEFRNLALQEHRLARRREREVAELRRLQLTRKEKEEEALAAAAKAHLLAQHRKQPLAKIPGLGFVFSKSRFVAYMSRLNPAQRGKFLQEAIAESLEEPQTMEAVA